jgi:hypothetical protein
MNDISGPDVCGGMTYPDQMDVEECHIRTRCMWMNDISRPDGYGKMTDPDQMDMAE